MMRFVKTQLCYAAPSVLHLTFITGGGEGVNSHVKRMGVLVGKFEKNLSEEPRSCFVGFP